MDSGAILQRATPGILISVRSAAEAIVARDGGADIIDVKEPSRGSLGAATYATIKSVVGVVNGQHPVSAALGELIDYREGVTNLRAVPGGVSFLKLGLAGCAKRSNWVQSWSKTLLHLSGSTKPIAVVYADWKSSLAPSPSEILNAAVEIGCPAILIDTYHKNGGTLFDHWPIKSLRKFMSEAEQRGVQIVLAGSLCGTALIKAASLRPSMVAVRGAACAGGRDSSVCPNRVAEVRAFVDSAVSSAKSS